MAGRDSQKPRTPGLTCGWGQNARRWVVADVAPTLTVGEAARGAVAIGEQADARG
jgi:hypothetical protein